MKYIDALIPLFGGIYILMFPDNLIRTKDNTYDQKKSLLKKAGIGLVAISFLYFITKLFQ